MAGDKRIMKKKSFIDDVKVKDPCTQAWDEMVGNDKVRFCTHCAKDVNNLSAMTRKEAIRLVRKSGGSLCIRYVQQPRTKQPMFADQLTQITRRRVPLMAAGVMSASLSLATLTYAQGGAFAPLRTPPMGNGPAAAQVSECEDTADNVKKKSEVGDADVGGLLRGTVIDLQGAVVPGMSITLNDANGQLVKNQKSDEDGAFRFEGLAPGTYVLQTEAERGFRASRVENISVGDTETAIEITLNISSELATVGVVAIGPEFEGSLAIAVANDDLNETRNLISGGENVNRKEEDGTTPIFIAVENGNLPMVQLLLDAGAKINARNKEKQTPIMRLDPDASVAMVDLLLRYGAKVNQVSKLGNTALILAAHGAQPEVLKALIDAGAALDVQNEEGMTALMIAADADNLENARVLILAGANVNLRDKEGETAWDKTSDRELESLLESYGAVVEDDSENAETQP